MGFVTPGSLNKRVRGVYLFELVESSPPALPVTYVSGVGSASDIGVPSWTTPDMVPSPPSGANLFMLAGVVAVNTFGGSPTLSGCLANAMPMDQQGASQPLYFGNGTSGLYQLLPGPNIATDITASWIDGAFEAVICAAVYDNVSQAAPYSDLTFSGGLTTDEVTVVSVIVPNCVAGDKVAGFFGCADGGVTTPTFAVTGTSLIQNQDSGIFAGGAWVETTALADGNCTLETTILKTGAAQLAWSGFGLRLNAD